MKFRLKAEFVIKPLRNCRFCEWLCPFKMLFSFERF
jgi:hypothetical protein